MLLTALEKEEEITKAAKDMSAILETGIEGKIESKGEKTLWHRENFKAPVFYHPDYNLWCAVRPELNASAPRYYFSYGIGRPEKDAPSLYAKIQTSCSIHADKRVSGMYARDENGGIHLVHSGKVGGGRGFITKDLFLRYYNGERAFVQFDGQKEREMIYIGRIDSDPATLLSSLYDFTVSAWEAKEQALLHLAGRKNAARTKSKPSSHSKNWKDEKGERQGYQRQGYVEPSGRHADVMNTLAAELEKQGYDARKDQYCDLILHKGKQLLAIFEAKSSGTTQCLYTAYGQLFLNSDHQPKYRVLVAPHDSLPYIIHRIEQLGVNVLFFEWTPQQVTFTNLDKVLNMLR